MILGVFSVSDMPVREIMIPRPHMITLDVNEELNAVVNKVIKSGHSRFPVINTKPDEILGILHAKDLLKNQIKTFLFLLELPEFFLNNNKFYF